MSLFPSTHACVCLERPPALQALPRRLASPVCTCRGHTGAVTPLTGTSEPCCCSRASALRAIGNGHPAHRYFRGILSFPSAPACARLEQLCASEGSVGRVDAPVRNLGIATGVLDPATDTAAAHGLSRSRVWDETFSAASYEISDGRSEMT